MPERMLPSWRLPLIFLCLIAACDFQPSGDNLVVLPQPDSSGMTIDLPLEGNDTLFLFTRTLLTYKSFSNQNNVKYVRAFLNDSELAYNPAAQGSFVIEAQYKPNGYYQLRLDLHASSGTGSLAEVREKEDFVTSKSWTIAIDNSAPSPISIKNIQRNDGTLEITWEGYKKFNFESYSITRYAYNAVSGYYQHSWTKTISDINITSLNDSAFVGGQVKYAIHVTAAEKSGEPREKEFVEMFDLDLNAAWVDKTRVKLTWRKNHYYRNFDRYEIRFSHSSFRTDDRVFTVENIQDTTLTVDTDFRIFPAYKEIAVFVHSKEADPYGAGYIRDYAHVTLGDPFPHFTYPNIIYNKQLNKYFTFTTDAYALRNSLTRIDGTTHQREDVISSIDRFTLSDNGQYCYITEGDLIKQINPADFTVMKEVDLASLTGQQPGYQWSVSVANNNFLAAASYSGSFVINMATNAIVQQLPSDFNMKISPDGKFLVYKGELRQWNNTAFTAVFTLGNPNWMSIHFAGDEKLILAYAGSIKVVNLASLSIERSIISKAFDIQYDPVNNLLSGRNSQFDNSPPTIYLFSLDESEAIKEISGYWTVVLNNRLLSPGATLPLSYYYP